MGCIFDFFFLEQDFRYRREKKKKEKKNSRIDRVQDSTIYVNLTNHGRVILTCMEYWYIFEPSAHVYQLGLANDGYFYSHPK